MSVTTLDSNTALVVIDLQKGIAALPVIHPVDQIAERANALAAAFRSRGLPVVLVNVAGGAPGRAEYAHNTADFPADWTDLIPELTRDAEDHLVTKQTWGAFPGTALESWLRSQGVTQIVLAGIATSIGVESTAREAHALGFNVTLAVDAMTDLSAEAHDNSVSRIFPWLGETGTSEEIVALVQKAGS
ncbi:isochorismatase family protein [Paraburkholderia caledonica]|uniref:isochorismatase family protein n=1 Tax=Paraburkholderia caledonica TaxID=134536 RepID=UPI000B406C69|nr:isochorismatase family protein [Paraburkholderia caledonica]